MVTLGRLQVLLFQKAFKVPPSGLPCVGLLPTAFILAPPRLPPRETQHFQTFMNFQGRKISHIREKKEVLTQQQTC